MKKIGYKTKAAAAAEAAAKMERKPARRNDARIIRRVIRRQESVTRKDIADWKRARLQATSTYEPKQVLLQRLFSEVIDDALMTSQVSVLRIGKSQGAEFPAVVLPVADVPARLCYRNLLYTGVTRARKLCVLTGTARTEQAMVENVRQNMRYSGLRYLLKDAATPTEEKAHETI